MDENPSPVPSSTNIPKLNRSCEECRARKIRCYISDSPGSSRCTRCIQRELPCTFVPAAKRKRRRVDSRIKELEKKIESLLPIISREDHDDVQEGGATIVNSLSETPLSMSNSTQPSSTPGHNGQDDSDVIESGLITISKAIELYQYFQNELSPHYPAIFILPSISAERVRHEKPSLFLSIITAAAASFEPSIAPALNQALETSHARCVMIDGEKSLGLAQALLISAIWNYPPNKFDGLKFGRYAQMAADILIDLGLPHKLDPLFSSDGRLSDTYCGSQYELMDECRTLVACFLLCSSIALSFRRPSAITFTQVIGKCIIHLKSSAYAAPRDKRLAIWAELQHQAEDINSALTINGLVSRADERAYFHVRDSIVGLKLWMQSIDQQQLNDSMTIHYHYIHMYAHERILHSEHRPEDFKPPYVIRGVTVHENSTPPPDHNTLFALNECLLSGRLLLDTFLGMTISTLRTIPVVVYTRMFYAIIIFAKLYTSAQSLDSRFQGLIDVQSLAFDSYIWRLITALQAARGPENFRVPRIFLGMLERLSQWCIARLQLQLQHQQPSDARDEWQPMNYIDAPEPASTPHSINAYDTLSSSSPWATNFESILPFLNIN